MTYTEQVSLTVINCGNCGAPYAISERYRLQKEQQGGTWNCPYCNIGWGYVQSENARLRRELEAKAIALTAARCETLREQQQREKAERKLRRVHRGVCPECKRCFGNLSRHMATRHRKKEAA